MCIRDSPISTIGQLGKGLYDVIENGAGGTKTGKTGGSTGGGTSKGTDAATSTIGGDILKDIDPQEVAEARKLEEQGVQDILDNEEYSPFEKFWILLTKASQDQPIKLGEKNEVDDETEDLKVYPEGEKQGEQLILTDVDKEGNLPDTEPGGKYEGRRFGTGDTQTNETNSGAPVIDRTGPSGQPDEPTDTTGGGTATTSGGSGTPTTADKEDEEMSLLDELLKSAAATAGAALTTSVFQIIDAEVKAAVGYGSTIGGIANDELEAKYPGAGTFDHLQGQSQGSPVGAGISNTLLETMIQGQFSLAASRNDLSLDEVMEFSQQVARGPFSNSIQDGITAKSTAEKSLTEQQTKQSLATTTQLEEMLPVTKELQEAQKERTLMMANKALFEGDIAKWKSQVDEALRDTNIAKGKHGAALEYAENYSEEFVDWLRNQGEVGIKEIITDPKAIIGAAIAFMAWRLGMKGKMNSKSKTKITGEGSETTKSGRNY